MKFIIDLLLEKRNVLALVTLAFSLFVAVGIGDTRMEATSKSLLSDSDPFKLEVEMAQEDFPPTTGVLFAFEADDIFALESLQAMEALTQRYSEVKSAIAVNSLLNQRFNDSDQKIYGRDYLIPELEGLTASDTAKVREIALNDEDIVKNSLSKTGDMALAQIRYKNAEDDQATRLEIARSVIALRDSLRSEFPSVDIYVLGGLMFELDGINARTKDNQVLLPLVLTIGILLLWFCLRSLPFSISLMAMAALSFTATMGTYGWLNIAFNQISTLGPLVVIVIAIADGIHVLSIYAQGLHKDMNKIDAMRESLRVNIQPITLATVTTAMGFLSLNYSSSPGIYGFGNIIAIGVVWAYIVTLAILPALVLLLPTNKVPKPLGIAGFIRAVIKLVTTRGNVLFWASAAIIAVTLGLLPLNKLDFDRFTFVDEDSDAHHVLTALSEKIGNDQALAYSIDSGEYYGITQPEFLQQVETLSIWLEAQPESSFVTSYTDYLRSRNKSDNDDDEAYDILPEDQLQIIDYLVGYQLVQEIEPSLQPIFNADYSAVRLVIATSNLSNKELLDFNDRIDDWIAENVQKKYKVLHGDNSILYVRLDRLITMELMYGFMLSFFFITITMIIGLQSWRYGLLSIMPNLFPATIVFGVWAVFVGELSPYILMLFSISIGLVVDDSVHILSKYISGKKDGMSPESASVYSLDRAGSAITITTLSLALGTFILVFSSTPYFQSVASLLTPIIIVAWALDLFFLPPLLIKFDNWMDRNKAAKTR
ncbi:MAG: MMPL family transporter [Pseudomonadales bacterium]|nr:MMPL family transporter [Pseudomonadales bacterium]